jgi:lipid A 3-O-deacylase
MKTLRSGAYLIIVFFFTIPPVSEGGASWDAIGFRASIGDSRNKESYSQYEVYVNFNLPWAWRSEPKWIVGSFVGINVGAIVCEKDAFLGSIGPEFYVLAPSQRLSFSAGIYPTYISRSSFGIDNFGGPFQFTSALDIDFHFLRQMSLGYRFQHMSNAGLFDKNPGLNTHILELTYLF